MNWGTKIVIGMALFMSFIVLLGILMIRSAADPLVDKDYYEKGLNYEQEIQRLKQVRKDSLSAINKGQRHGQ